MLNEARIKKLTPRFMRDMKRRMRDRDQSCAFAGLSNQEVFEKIYEEGVWGRAEDGNGPQK